MEKRDTGNILGLAGLVVAGVFAGVWVILAYLALINITVSNTQLSHLFFEAL